MAKQKYERIENENFSMRHRMKSIWNDPLLMLFLVFVIAVFLTWSPSKDDTTEANFDSLRGSEHDVNIPSTYYELGLKGDGKSSSLGSEEVQSQYIASAIDGAEDELISVENNEVYKTEEQLLEDMENAENKMISDLKVIVNKVSDGSITEDETESIVIEAIDQLEEKELDKISSLADMVTDNGEAAIEQIADEDKKKGYSNIDIVYDINDKETEAEQDIRDVIEEETDQIMLSIGEDAKEVVAKVIKDLLNVDISGLEEQEDTNFDDHTSEVVEGSDDKNNSAKEEKEDGKKVEGVGDELQTAKDALQYLEEEDISEAEEELLDNMDKTEENMALKISALVDKLPVSMTDMEKESVLKDSIKVLEKLELSKLESTGKVMIENADHNLDEVAKKDENEGKAVQQTLEDIDATELKAENDISMAINDKTKNIIASLDEDVEHVAEDAVEDYIGDIDISGGEMLNVKKEEDSSVVSDELTLAKERSEYVEYATTLTTEEEILESKSTEKIEDDMKWSISNLMEKLFSSPRTDEIKQVEEFAIKRFENKEFDKVNSAGENLLLNVKNDLDEIVKKDMDEGMTISEVLNDINITELAFNTALLHTMDNETESALKSLSEDAKNTIIDVFKDFLNVDISATDVDMGTDSANSDDKPNISNLDNITKEAAADIEYIAVGEEVETETKILDHLQQVKSFLKTYITSSMEKIPGVQPDDIEAVNLEVIKSLEDIELNKINSLTEQVSNKAISKVKQTVIADLKEGTSTLDLQNDIEAIEIEAEEELHKTLEEKFKAIEKSLDDEAKEVAEEIIKKFEAAKDNNDSNENVLKAEVEP